MYASWSKLPKHAQDVWDQLEDEHKQIILDSRTRVDQLTAPRQANQHETREVIDDLSNQVRH